MTREITITTGARLHFGLLSHRPAAGRTFGGAGLMVDAPRFKIVARPSEVDVVKGSPDSMSRGEAFLACYRNNCLQNHQPLPCRLEIRDEISPHTGLGSGTQLGLAIAQALALLGGDDDVEPAALAERVGRGARSALGIHGFNRGGFLVDGGKSGDASIGVLAARVEFPADWRMLLITPDTKPGLSGAPEREAFAQLPSMPQTTTDRLCGIVLMRMLPAIVEANFAQCGEALFEFGRTVGEYFASVQGGIYADESMSRLVEHLRQAGIQGVGQTSWGPTIFALCPDQKSAEQLAADSATDPRWSSCRCLVTAPMNTGCVIQIGESRQDVHG